MIAIRGPDMKRLLIAASFAITAAAPATASSFEWVDQTITGPTGPSMVAIGEATACGDTACVDPTGGDKALFTASSQRIAALNATPQREINVTFARKFPDPAIPVPAPMGDDMSSGGGEPSLPADVGNVPPQPPVDPMAEPMPTDPNAPPMPGSSPMEQAAALNPQGFEQPGAPVPLADSELRDND
jgi:hypothetical protein